MVAKKVSSELEAQLSAFHDPFSRLTQHPKIPDGTTPWSFGQTTSYVKEISNAESHDILEFIVFAGQNTNCSITGSQLQTTGTNVNRLNYIIPFEDTGGMDYSAVVAHNPSVAGYEPITAGDLASRWRTVSTGIQLKLLNSAEENDGWWEAVRLTDQFDTQEWKMTTPGNQNAIGNDSGCVAPSYVMFDDLLHQSLQNQPSYSTGMLKDLHLVQFQLNGSLYKERWTENPAETMFYLTPDTNVDANQELVLFESHAGNRKNLGGKSTLMNQFIDNNYDMIYIRCYCRPNQPNLDTQNGSRFHLTSVMNKEVVYDKDVKESRYMTRTENLGVSMMDAHTQLRSLNKFAATPVNI